MSLGIGAVLVVVGSAGVVQAASTESKPAQPELVSQAGEPSSVSSAPASEGDPAPGDSKPSVGADAGDASDADTENELPPGTIPQPGGFSIAVGGQLSAGQSTFQRGNRYSRDPQVSWSGSLSAAYLFSDMSRLSVGTSINQELTVADGADDPQTLILGDTGINYGIPLYNFDGGPRIFGSASAQLPTSEASRQASLITSVSAGLSAAQPVAGVFLSLSTSFTKNFHQYTNPIRDPNTGENFITRDGEVVRALVTGLSRQGGNEQVNNTTLINGDVQNRSFGWSNSLSVFYPATEHLGLIAGYNLSQSWAYEAFPLDEQSGVGARAGRGRSDSHGGMLMAMYTVGGNLNFRVGMATGGPTRSADDKRIRFPFFNFEGEESNMTSFFFGVTLTEAVPL